MHRVFRASLTGIVLILAIASLGLCAVKKPAPAKPAPMPKVLKIVAGQPFETPPSTGAAKISLTLCADETEPATFTVRSGKAFAGVTAACIDLVGRGKIPRQNVTVRLVQGNDLQPCDGISLDSTPKQLWVDVSVPKDAKPGLYKGSVLFSVNGKQFDVVPIEVTVRSLRLVGSSKQYALYTSVESGAQDQAYARFLKNIAGMGFRSVAASSGEAFGACAAAGLIGMMPVLTFGPKLPTPSIEDVRTVESARKAAGISSAFYFCAHNPASDLDVQAALDKASALRRAGVQPAVTVCDDAMAQKLLPGVDGINYRIDSPYVQALINGGTIRTNKWEWYWWDARQSVQANRINAGVGLWRSGLYGCMPMWMPSGEGDSGKNLDSLLCEALREGVNDTRYITTYMKALRELKDKKRASDKDYIASTEAYLSAFLAKPLDNITAADLRGFRAKMAEFSTKLAARLKA